MTPQNTPFILTRQLRDNGDYYLSIHRISSGLPDLTNYRFVGTSEGDNPMDEYVSNAISDQMLEQLKA